MAKLTMTGDILILTSDFTVEEINYIETHRPEKTIVVDDKNDQRFRVCVGSASSFSYWGVVFDKRIAREGQKASVSIPLQLGDEPVEDYIFRKYGQGFTLFEKLEGEWGDTLEEIELEKLNFMKKVTTI